MKRILSILLISLMVLSLTACNKDKDPMLKLSKQELVNQIYKQQELMNSDAARIEELETLLRGIQTEDAPTAAISVIPDGTGRLTFNSIHDKIIFPVPFEYPNSTQAPATGSVKVTESITVVPSASWFFKLNGTSLELEHPLGVNGIIKAATISDTYPRDRFQEDVFSVFFADFPPENIKYSKLFLDDIQWGLQAVTPTTIDKGPAMLRCGMVGLGEQCFTYIFLYKGEADQTKDELELALLKTIKLFGSQLRIE